MAAAELRRFCPATSRNGRRCDFAEHPGEVHWTWVNGELQQWQRLPAIDETWSNREAVEDPLRDAPDALRPGGKASALSRILNARDAVVRDAKSSPSDVGSQSLDGGAEALEGPLPIIFVKDEMDEVLHELTREERRRFIAQHGRWQSSRWSHLLRSSRKDPETP